MHPDETVRVLHALTSFETFDAARRYRPGTDRCHPPRRGADQGRHPMIGTGSGGRRVRSWW